MFLEHIILKNFRGIDDLNLILLPNTWDEQNLKKFPLPILLYDEIYTISGL